MKSMKKQHRIVEKIISFFVYDPTFIYSIVQIVINFIHLSDLFEDFSIFLFSLSLFSENDNDFSLATFWLLLYLSIGRFSRSIGKLLVVTKLAVFFSFFCFMLMMMVMIISYWIIKFNKKIRVWLHQMDVWSNTTNPKQSLSFWLWHSIP